MRLRIQSDGTSGGTKVLDERGDEVENIKQVFWVASADKELCTCTLILHNVQVDVMTQDFQEIEGK